jgi:hypothetical protein
MALNEEQKSRLRAIIQKPIKDYTPEEDQFLRNCMLIESEDFEELLEEARQKLREEAKNDA